MTNIHHYSRGVIPPHILNNVAEHHGHEARDDARATLEQMREVAATRSRTLTGRCVAAAPEVTTRTRKHLSVYDAGHQTELPGKLAMSEHKPRSTDAEVGEAYDGSSVTYDFFAKVFDRDSIDGRGMRIDSTVHYSTRFDNAMWDGRQMIYGDGDGRIFNRFTAALEVIGHELTHGITQHSAALGYSGQTGALNEHLSDAFGIMVKQYALDQSADESDWLIGVGLFTPAVHGQGIRSMAAPGTAYDDPVLGRDPQPARMRDYVHTRDDNGGVHINSGILNHAFYRAAKAIGGKPWDVLGKIWYRTMMERLKANANFKDFARATVDVAGELYGNGGQFQRIVADAWAEADLGVKLFGRLSTHQSPRVRRPRAAAAAAAPKWRQRPLR
jgi:Zn-dependent metalloprotease